MTLPQLQALDIFGVNFTGVEIHGGVGLILNSVENSAPSPIVSFLGLSLPIRFSENLTFRPEFTFFHQHYGYQDQRAIPLEPIFDSVLLLGVGIFPWVGMEWDILDVVTGGWEATIGFTPRFPIFFVGTGGEKALDITAWYLAGRFLYPSGAGFITWKFSELFRFTVRTQVLLPVYNLWTPTEIWDQTQFNLLIGIRWDL